MLSILLKFQLSHICVNVVKNVYNKETNNVILLKFLFAILKNFDRQCLHICIFPRVWSLCSYSCLALFSVLCFSDVAVSPSMVWRHIFTSLACHSYLPICPTYHSNASTRTKHPLHILYHTEVNTNIIIYEHSRYLLKMRPSNRSISTCR